MELRGQLCLGQTWWNGSIPLSVVSLRACLPLLCKQLLLGGATELSRGMSSARFLRVVPSIPLKDLRAQIFKGV